MKKIKILSRAFITLLTASSLFIACQKSSETQDAQKEETEQAIATSEADAEADVLFDDVFDNVMGINDEVGLGGALAYLDGLLQAMQWGVLKKLTVHKGVLQLAYHL